MSVLVRFIHKAEGQEVYKDEVTVEASTVREALQQFSAQNDKVRNRLFHDSGELRRLFLVFVNEEDMRFLQKLETLLKSGDEITIILRT